MRATLLLLAAAVAAGAAESPLLEKPLPPLRLSHPLQGDAWSVEALRGQVLVLDVFQLG